MDFNKNSKDVISKELGVKRFLKSVASAVAVMFLSAGLVKGLSDERLKAHYYRPAPNASEQISDEGFRWRKSPNFTINGKPVEQWEFVSGKANYATDIHKQLSILVNRALECYDREMHDRKMSQDSKLRGSNHMAAGALTIVEEKNGKLGAYTKIITEPVGSGNGFVEKMAVSVPCTLNFNALIDEVIFKSLGYSAYYTTVKTPAGQQDVMRHVTEVCSNIVKASKIVHILGNYVGIAEYGCCEGEIVTRLFDTNPPNITLCEDGVNRVEYKHEPLFAKTLMDLIKDFNLRPDKNAVKLVILHIHSKKDPCAKCAKVFAALSRELNNQASQLRCGLVQQFNWLEKAKFLIEVSSNEPYEVNKCCSLAELSGQDGVQSDTIDISTDNKTTGKSGTIFDGAKCDLAFPPYVLFTRINEKETYVPSEKKCGLKHTSPRPTLMQLEKIETLQKTQ